MYIMCSFISFIYAFTNRITGYKILKKESSLIMINISSRLLQSHSVHVLLLLIMTDI